jgi:micrococcal nuclease
MAHRTERGSYGKDTVRRGPLGAVLVAAVLALVPVSGRLAHPRALAADGTTCRVVRVFDGDTIAVRCSGREDLIRYIGINAPETHHPTRGEEPGGREAAEANERLVGRRRVRLETDVQVRDGHRRLLAYVWVQERGGGEVMANARMLALGCARLMTIPPNVRHVKEFVALEREARRAGRGLWAAHSSGAGPRSAEPSRR